MINTGKIKGRLRELGLTQSDVARALGLAQPTVAQKINRVRPMTVEEAEKLSQLLKISNEEFSAYFFAEQFA